MPIYGPWVKTTGSNLYTTGDQDMQAATSLLVPASAGYAPTADASLGYDTTADRFVLGGRGVAGTNTRRVGSGQSTSDQLAAATIGTTETAFANTLFTVPANYLITGRMLRITVAWEITTSATAPSHRLRMRVQKSGPTNVNLYDSGVGTPGNSLATRGLGMILLLTGTAAAGAAAATETSVLLQGASFAPQSSNTLAQTINVDTTADQAIQFTLQYGAGTAGNTLNLRSWLVEEVA